MEKLQKGILSIEMLGGFTLSYEGKEVVLGRSTTAKFVQLLQLIWLQGEKGIAKEQVIQSLYDRDSLNNINNSFNNLLYQMRRQMIRAGLPEGEYIRKKDGVFRADDTVDLKIDAVEFRHMMELAELAETEEKTYQYYSLAFELYKGELLPGISTEIWVTAESFEYKAMFERCARWLGSYLQKQKEYHEMYRIYSKAAEIYPFDDWQALQIDALLCRGEYKEAFQLYDKTVRRYSEEMGLPPSEQLLKCYEEMSRKITSCPNEITEIKNELKESFENFREGYNAYYCSYPSFVDVYRLLSRNMERTGRSIFLMLCTLVDYEGKVIQNQGKLKYRSEELGKAIGCTLRRGDVYTRYSTSQYLILLVGTNQEDCVAIHRRISRKLKELAGPRAEVNYSIASLAELPEEFKEER